ncbi:hypothetical protein [Micromonospora sp. NPDC049799]|uniref:hypothetical protein n=1 Tax=Micromonospora sp. NPDC049799 TaxID=3154741 RepID=UPI0033CA96E8
MSVTAMGVVMNLRSDPDASFVLTAGFAAFTVAFAALTARCTGRCSALRGSAKGLIGGPATQSTDFDHSYGHGSARNVTSPSPRSPVAEPRTRCVRRLDRILRTPLGSVTASYVCAT